MSTTANQQIMGLQGGAPPASSQVPSGRKGTKKVRTGCVTCKIRKVKCDETKPACLRCNKTGRKCDGYLPPKLPGHNPGGVMRLSPPVSPFADWAGGAKEQRAFDFYRNFSAPSIFSDGVSSMLWKKLVPHFCHAEPAIRHAVLAISSLHETLALPPGSNPAVEEENNHGVLTNTFAAEQYGKALKCLQEWKPTETSPATVPLLACLLFICIEFMLGDEGASQVHINQGRLILSQLEPSTDVDMIKKHFVPVYSRLALASFLFGCFPAAIPPNMKASSATNLFFSSVDEAEVALYELIDDGLRFTAKAKRAVYSYPPSDPTLLELAREQDDFLAKLSQWHVAFVVISAIDDALSKGKLCMVYYNAARIAISTAMDTLETAFDNHIVTFASIISTAAEFVHASRRVSGRDPSHAAMAMPKFVFDTEIIPPLYYVSIKCRHPMLRRAAVDLLKQETVTKRRENLWDAQLISEIGKRCINIEEEAARRRDESVDLTAGWDTVSWEESDGVPIGLFPTNNDRSIDCDYPVPRVQYPQIPKLTNTQINAEYERTMDLVSNLVQSRHTTPSSVSTGSTSSSSGGSSAFWGPHQLEAPFGLPEHARIKNALIDNESKWGSWITIFMDPKEAGAAHWKVTREFVRRSSARV
ncbi:Putative zn(2)Cys(6) fungal-type DNA-binding domain, fungal transcription factor [Colletotrichum destructivum]|uniref:Zn(2)Cys(6) fungal-type DNA-binding domain, fungal transcription factor n=1 Tax=Colletotrichum destructivum TaxID=34406 RepID=A0AAX4IUA3_9PEZI|nr:Putative zn(2)Cys(6) fungal-type DNA-binding domain, fungal transcription factor [Colletotrichum destructivum]